MEIVLAEPRGFCAGVRRAVGMLDEVLRTYRAPIYVFHEIVHNTRVVDSFRERGTIFVQSVEEVPVGSVLLFSAHGVSRHVREEAERRNLTVIDATCPLVAQIHNEAIRYAQDQYQIILVGHAGHDEVVGILGEAPEQIVLIEQPEQIEQLNFSRNQKITCLMQTTLLADRVALFLTRLKDRFPQLELSAKARICPATEEHQNAVRRAIPDCDAVLVVGSPSSSNTRRIYELAQSLGARSFQVDGPEEIRADMFRQAKKLLVTSGASVPEDLVQECIQRLRTIGSIRQD